MRPRRLSTAVSLIGLLILAGCSRGDGLTIPPLVEQPSPELPGKFVWHNLITPDAAAARAFYGGVFGWQFKVQDDGNYTDVSFGGRSLGGIVSSTGEGAPRTAVWLSAVSVSKIDATVVAAEAAGATQLIAARDIPNVGRVAVLSDPQGAVFQMIASVSGDPPDAPARMNTWLWRELIADDPATAADFYERVFGYDVTTVGENDEAYRVLSREGKPRAGILNNPFEETRPAWIPFVRVEDPAALLSTVTELGGTVVIAPRPDLRDGTLAVVLDPSGAPLALQKWNPGAQGEDS